MALDLETKRVISRQAIIDAIPLIIPAIPFALVLGLVITESGINNFLGWSSSSIIFSGAAQLTLFSLLGAGTAWVAAVTASLVIGARHIMYSAALAPVFQPQPRWFRWFGPYWLLDQVFALATVRHAEDPAVFRRYYLTSGAMFWTFWQMTVALGLAIGPIIPEEWNMGFAVPIMFVALVVMGIDRFPKLGAALVGAGVTYIFAGLPNKGGLLVGALAGVAVGYVLEVRSQ